MRDGRSLAARRAFLSLGAIGPTPASVDARECSDCGVVLIEARRGAEALLATRLRSEFELTPPDGPRRVSSPDVSLLGVGRSRWTAISYKEPKAFAQDLGRTLSDCASVIDQTDGLAILRVGGPRIRDTLAKGLPINLDATAFAIDDVAVSAIAHIGVTIWRLDDRPTFELAIPRSYAGAFSHWLQESAAEFGLEVG